MTTQTLIGLADEYAGRSQLTEEAGEAARQRLLDALEAQAAEVVALEAELAALKAQPVNQMLLDALKLGVELADESAGYLRLMPAFVNRLRRFDIDARAAIAQAQAQPTEPARVPNCGTGYCSCIECLMEPAPSMAGEHEPENEPGVSLASIGITQWEEI
jgi:hypothetical protein